jgi:hypothetical protein
MNSRQKAGLSMGISGVVALGVGIVVGSTTATPTIVDIVLKILATVLPLLGLVVNFPSDTNPK